MVKCMTDLVDHVLKLGLGWILTQGAHDSTELLGCDGSISICVSTKVVSIRSNHGHVRRVSPTGVMRIFELECDRRKSK